jgi:flagellar motor switch protein FliG
MTAQREPQPVASEQRRSAGDVHDGIRKTAILIDSVDQPTAEILFAQISLEVAAQVRTALLELGDVDPQEQTQVLAEFLEVGVRSSLKLPPTESDSLPQPPTAEPLPEAHTETAAAGANDLPDGMREVPQVESPTAALARGLAQEHAQTICLVLANLPPQQATALLQQLPPARQSEVLRRLTQLEAAAPEVLADVGSELQPWGLSAAESLPDSPERASWQASGPPAACANDAPPWQASARGTMPEDRRPAQPCRAESGDAPPLADFDDLVRLDDGALARVFAAAAPEIVLLALSGANRDLIDRLVCRLPASAGRTLRRQLETLGPTRLRDIEAAQQQLAELAGQMCRQGLIRVPNRRRFTMAA